MTYAITDFATDAWFAAAIHVRNPNRATELGVIAAALTPDTTTRDTTIQTAPTGLVPGLPSQSKFTNETLLAVNKGRAGGLTPVAMSGSLTTLAGALPV